MPRILAIANRKGGVGKTTTTVNVATAMAAAGKKVLVVDLDPQGNASTSMGVNKRGRMNSSYEVLLGECKLGEAVVWTEIPNFSLIPSSPDLAAAEIELVDIEHREFALKKALQKDAVNYDYILIDCPPSLGLLTTNALTAANSVLIPVQCEYYALEGVTQLLITIRIVQQTSNSGLKIEGILMTMYNSSTNLSAEVSQDVRQSFGKLVYQNSIPRNVRLSEAPSRGLSIFEYDPRSKGAVAYMALCEELLNRNGDK